MINFVGLNFIKIDKPRLRKLIGKISSVEGYRIERMLYNFVAEAKMTQLNKVFLDHDTNTDIITFDYTKNKIISAEVFISKKMLSENALKNEQTLENEVVRLISHAVLHCVGYKDKTKQEKERMRKKENAYINTFHVKQDLNV